MGFTTDGFPYVGDLPDKPGQFVCAGFNGHGMPQVFLSAKAIASMVIEGTKLEDTDLPRLYRSSRERLESADQHACLVAHEAAMKPVVQAQAKL